MAEKRIQTLMRIFPKLTASEARDLAMIMRRADSDKSAEQALKKISEVTGSYGVEVINGPHFRRNYWANALLAYVNVGDTYQGTVGFETENAREYGYGRFILLPGGWGSWVEWYESKHGEGSIE